MCNCQVKISNKRYTSITHDYCLMFDSNTLIERQKDDPNIQVNAFCFTDLIKIEAKEKNQRIDVVGLILELTPTV